MSRWTEIGVNLVIDASQRKEYGASRHGFVRVEAFTIGWRTPHTAHEDLA